MGLSRFAPGGPCCLLLLASALPSLCQAMPLCPERRLAFRPCLLLRGPVVRVSLNLLSAAPPHRRRLKKGGLSLFVSTRACCCTSCACPMGRGSSRVVAGGRWEGHLEMGPGPPRRCPCESAHPARPMRSIRFLSPSPSAAPQHPPTLHYPHTPLLLPLYLSLLRDDL